MRTLIVDSGMLCARDTRGNTTEGAKGAAVCALQISRRAQHQRRGLEMRWHDDYRAKFACAAVVPDRHTIE